MLVSIEFPVVETVARLAPDLYVAEGEGEKAHGATPEAARAKLKDALESRFMAQLAKGRQLARFRAYIVP